MEELLSILLLVISIVFLLSYRRLSQQLLAMENRWRTLSKKSEEISRELANAHEMLLAFNDRLGQFSAQVVEGERDCFELREDMLSARARFDSLATRLEMRLSLIEDWIKDKDPAARTPIDRDSRDEKPVTTSPGCESNGLRDLPGGAPSPESSTEPEHGPGSSPEPGNTNNTSPEGHGGRPRKGADEDHWEPSDVGADRAIRFSVACRKIGLQWIVGLRVLGDRGLTESLEVFQGSNLLQQDAETDSFITLPEPAQSVRISWKVGGDSKSRDLLLDRSHLVFKLKAGFDEGRMVKLFSRGSYAVIVPDSWQRADAGSHSANVEPEMTVWDGYMVHFFDIDEGERSPIRFRDLTGTEHVIYDGLAIEIEGDRLPDSRKGAGPLFGGRVPFLRILANRHADIIHSMVIGDEGAGRRRWRKGFPWKAGENTHDLPEELAQRGSGWYFVRLYDRLDDLITSFDFRYIPALERVAVGRLGIQDGVYSGLVKFTHRGEVVFSPEEDAPQSAVPTRHEDSTGTSFRCESPEGTCTLMVHQNPGVPISLTIDISVPAWGLANEPDPPTFWTDQPLGFTRGMFRAISATCVWIRVSGDHKSLTALAGFERQRAGKYRIDTTDRIMKIPLRDFANAVEMERSDEASFSVWQDVPGLPCTHFKLGVLPRLVTIHRCTIDDCDFSTADPGSHKQHLLVAHDVRRYLDLVQDYDEFLRHFRISPEMPAKIYRCTIGDCRTYVAASDPFDEPVDILSLHWMKEHDPAAKHSFAIVRNVDEIRQHVIKQLPTLYRCRFRDRYFEEMELESVWEHFLAHHREEILQLETNEDVIEDPH